MTALTGPNAPHSFSLVKRKNLGATALGDAMVERRWADKVQARQTAGRQREPQPHPDDVVMLVKDWITTAVAQTVVVIPACEIDHLRRLPEQPMGLWPRRPVKDSDRWHTENQAQKVHAAGGISKRACDYLTEWSNGTRWRCRRPERYAFLTRPSYVQEIARCEAVPVVRREFRPVHVAGIGLQALAEEPPQNEEDSRPLEIE